MSELHKRIAIKDLEVGMYVERIDAQSGNILVKSQGLIKNNKAIALLKAKGVTHVIVNTSKSQLPDTKDGKEADDGVTINTESSATSRSQEGHKKATHGFAAEIQNAIKLQDRGKNIQQTLLDAVAKGLPFDTSIPRAFANDMVSSINRNPDALLCLTKIREKDDYLLEHSLNVAVLLAHFARYLGMSNKEIEDIAYAAFVHDLGKIKISDDILHKPGRLTDPEMAIMRKHVNYGVDFLKDMGVDSYTIRIVSEHHERLDGLGYPNQVAGADISREGRMLAIVDMYDALTADRCYKPGMPSQKAMQILLKDSEHKIDPGLLQRFIKCMGIYPIGSLIELSNDRVAVVIEQNHEAPLKPLVKVFYSISSGHYVAPQDIDLRKTKDIKVTASIVASKYNIDVNKFFHQSVLK